MEAPLFVVAYPHSGTTMLREALSRNPAVFACRSETKFFERLGEIERRFSPLDSPEVRADFVRFVAALALADSDAPAEAAGESIDDAAVRELSSLPGDHVALFVATLDHLAARRGASRWLEKTPEHIFAIDRIRASIPNAVFLEVVRSPLDVLASKKFRQGVAAARRAAGREYRERFFHPVWDAVTWKAAVAAGARGGAIRIRYEDIVADPEATLRHVCDRVGLDFTPDMLQVRRQNARFQTGDEGVGVSRLSVGHWQESLTRGEVALIGAVVRRPAGALGYDVPRVVPDRSVVTWTARTAIDPISRVASHARQRGWRGALRSVTGYLRRSAR